MNLGDRIKNAANAFAGNKNTPQKTENSSLRSQARDFLRNGTGSKPLIQEWSDVVITDEDMYTGYSYAAITKRANKTAWLSKNFLMTSADPKTVEQYQASERDLVHPYLELIRNSTEFTQKKFWYDISTYLDLEGIYYLMAVRAVDEKKDGTKRVGAIQKFVMLNPYEVRRVKNEKTGEVGGYIEYRDGLYREIPKEMIIEVRLLNPFDRDKSYSMTDAAKDSQFTLKQAGDYTRHSIQGNINAPGAITTDVVLDDNVFANFVSRIRNHEKGEPLYGNGTGSINWDSMQIDLDKAALGTINEINRSTLFAVSGMSKTAMGIEESGTTRDVSQTQNDNFVSDAIIPRTEDIIDALNLDYRKWYFDDWMKNKFEIIIDNPLESDRDAEKKDIEIRDTSYDLSEKLIAAGYDRETARKFAMGEITLEDLGEPEELEEDNTTTTTDTDTTDTTSTDAVVDEDSTKDDEPERGTDAPDTSKTVENQLSARQFPSLYDELDIDLGDLGCIMLDIKPVSILQHVSDGDMDLVQAEEGDHAMGAVAETEAHVTLLYGLLENGNLWADKVDAVLAGWLPGKVTVEEVGYFDTPDSYAIVAHIKKTTEIQEGHDRLTLLPHVNTFTEYKPHMTLAYIRKDADLGKWLKSLNAVYAGAELTPLGINYGDLPPEDEDDVDNYGVVNGVKGTRYTYKGSFIAKSDIPAKVLEELEAPLHIHDHTDENVQRANNELGTDGEARSIVEAQMASLQAGVAKIESQVAADAIEKLEKNAFEDQSDIITKEQKEQHERELNALLTAFYTVVMPLYGNMLLQKRSAQFDKQVPFEMSADIKKFIKESAKGASESHINTVVDDFLKTVSNTYNSLVEAEMITLIAQRVTEGDSRYTKLLPDNPTQDQIKRAVRAGKFTDTPIYEEASKLAMQGASRQTIIKSIQQKYANISDTRAKMIARTETSRAFNQSQYQADLQFLRATNQVQYAYKEMRSRSGHPCPFCQSIIGMGAIPFEKNFVNLGDDISATITKEDGSTVVRTLPINYESIEAGNVHPNCECEYVLSIRTPDGTVLNSKDGRVVEGIEELTNTEDLSIEEQ